MESLSSRRCKENARLNDSPPGLSPATACPSRKAEQRASGCRADRSVGRTLAPKRYLADSALSAPHAPDRKSCVASRRDILVERRPRDADRLADFVNCVLLLTVQINFDGTLLVTKLFSPAALPAPRPRRGEPGIRPFADQAPLKLRERPNQDLPAGDFLRILFLDRRLASMGAQAPQSPDLAGGFWHTILKSIAARCQGHDSSLVLSLKVDGESVQADLRSEPA
jgi:hypothetical protein